jgi:hypothetical protein
MTSNKNSESTQAPLPQQKPDTSLVSEMLTPSELESLRQFGNEAGAYAQKAFQSWSPPGL